MAKKDRRGAHRYKPEQDQFLVGWWTSGLFQSVPARLLDLSISGALLVIAEGEPAPEPGKVLISPAGGARDHWAQADVLEILCQDDGRRLLRLRLMEPFSYETFKTVIWGKLSSTHQPCPGVLQTAGANATAADHPDGHRKSVLSDAARLRMFLELSPGMSPAPASMIGHLRSDLPSLVESHRKNLPDRDRVEPVPWLTISLFGGIILLLLLLVVARQYDSARQIGIMLGLLR
jgi:hypothetical protein